MKSAEMRSPAPCVNTGNRAEVATISTFENSTDAREAEAFAAAFLTCRYGLSPLFARLVVRLAAIGGRCA
jgi:hypothetical protein